MTRIISIANQKGGVGKTTTAVSLAACLADRGCDVLLVDLDPQGNASSGLGFPRDENEYGAADALLGFKSLGDVMVETAWPGLRLVPSSRALIGLEVELVTLERREQRLRAAFQAWGRPFDYILLDCPPSLGLLTVNALAASHSVLIPLQAQYYAIEGLGQLLDTVAAVKRDLNPRLVREGVLITMADLRTHLSRDVEAQAREVFGRGVFETVIPRNVRLAEAPSYGRPVQHFDPSSRGARAYAALAAELLARHAQRVPVASFQVAK
ncbi:MAG: AAA family ATPase [Pseudomonadota bacterium]